MDPETALVLVGLGLVLGYAWGRPGNRSEAQVHKVRPLGNARGSSRRYRVELSVDLPHDVGERLDRRRRLTVIVR